MPEELDQDIRDHIKRETQNNIERGMSQRKRAMRPCLNLAFGRIVSKRLATIVTSINGQIARSANYLYLHETISLDSALCR